MTVTKRGLATKATRREASSWNKVKSSKPSCSRKPNTFGTPVLVWPYVDECHPDPVVMQAYYGTRVTNVPSFYLHGRVLDGITHWQLLPAPPTE